MAKKRYLVIGEGAAGATAAEELRRLDPHAAIGVYSDEPHPTYFRAALTNYLLGELREDQLFVNPPDFCESQRIGRAFSRVVHVDAARGEVWDASSSKPTPFDALLIASGARPRAASFQGADLPGVVTLRTLFDARAMMDTLRQGSIARAVVVGGGPLGLEWASALLERGVQVTVIERSNRLMASALDEVASDLLASRLRAAGVEVALGDEVLQARAAPSGRVGALSLRSGRELFSDFVAIALGVVPNTDFLRSASLRLAPSGALLVDRTLQSSAPNVWGAGDVASVDGEELALWEPAKHQGRTAARNMLGGRMRYEPGAHYFATRLFDLDFAKVGDIALRPGREQVTHMPRGTGKITYKKLVLEGGRLVGALLIGERSERVRAGGRLLKRLVDSRADVSAVKDRICTAHFDLLGWLDTQRLLAQPVPRQRTLAEIPPAARVRGTQAVRIPAALGTAAMQVPVAATPRAAGADALGTRLLQSNAVPVSSERLVAAGARGTRMLSIGLPAELGRAPERSLSIASAVLERGAERIPVTRSVTTLGSAQDADIPVADPGAALSHAQLVAHSGKFYLRDLGSRSGTWVNGAAITSEQRLGDGDRIQIGRDSLVFRMPGACATAPKTRALVRAPRLIVQNGSRVGLALRLAEQPLSIGSGSGSSVSLDDPGVAAEHARIGRHANGYAVLAVAGASWLRGQALTPSMTAPLTPGDWLRFGSVDLVYVEDAREEPAHALCPSGRLVIDSGDGAGQTADFTSGARVGSAEDSTLRLVGLAPLELEIVQHGRGFFVRDIGQRTLRSGRQLGTEWVPLEHGDLLMLSGPRLLRFEET